MRISYYIDVQTTLPVKMFITALINRVLTYADISHKPSTMSRIRLWCLVKMDYFCFMIDRLLFLMMLMMGFFGSANAIDVTQHDSIPPAVVVVPLADTSVVFHWHRPDNHRLMFLVIHDDENTSTRVAYSAMDDFGASLVEMKNDGKYHFTLYADSLAYIFNPNRIFSLNGIEGTLAQMGPCTPEVVEKISHFSGQVAGAFFYEPEFIVALHNNRNGGFSIESYLSDSLLMLVADEVFVNPEKDPDDFFYVIDPYHYEVLSKKGFNVILQTQKPFEDDGSLSVWCARLGVPYINVEAEHGRDDEQMLMLEAIRELLSR